MARLSMCHACGRHLRPGDRDSDCPFCGAEARVAPLPRRASVLLMGLCLTACAGTEPESKDGTTKASPAERTEPEDKQGEDGGREIADSAPADWIGSTEAGESTSEDSSGDQSDTEEDEAVPKTTANPDLDDGELRPDAGDQIVPAKPDPRPKLKYGAPMRPQKDMVLPEKK